MPDDKRPAEDGLADLFGRLPDPRKRAVEDASAGSGSIPPLPSSSAEDAADAAPRQAPLSRREMRELAANGGSASARPAPPAADAAQAVDAVPERGARAADIDIDLSDTAVSVPRVPAASAPDTGWSVVPEGAAAAGPRVTRAGAGEADAAPAPATGTAIAASTMTLDELFAEEKRIAPSKKEKRRNRRIGGWIALGVVVVLLGGIAGGGLWVWSNYEDQIRSFMGWEEPADYADGLANGEVLVTIADGDGGQAISQTLYDAGVTKTPEAFYSWLLGLDSVPTFYPGVYRLQLQMTSEAALAALEEPTNKVENSATVPEGSTVEQALPLLAEGIGLPLEDFQAAVGDPAAYGVSASSLEGWLFPATYAFDPGITAAQVVQAMVDRTVVSLDNAGVPVDDRQRILTIASIIQREAREESDFYKVSRVIENRMDPDNQETYGYLQMDSTAQYGYGEMHDGTVSSSAEALEDDNAWNTYKVAGLPAGPISNPGDVAIDAAMHPADGTWLYFVTVNLDTGETIFTDTYAEHQVAVAQWQAWCADNPDSGC